MSKHRCSFLFYFTVGMKRLSEMFSRSAFGNLRSGSCCRQGCLELECWRSCLPMNFWLTACALRSRLELVSLLVVLSVLHAGLRRRFFVIYCLIKYLSGCKIRERVQIDVIINKTDSQLKKLSVGLFDRDTILCY
jgi:hypothetical protein